TNDIAEIHSTNEFDLIGRWDNIINSGGYKINPEKVENLIQKLFSDQKEKLHFFVGKIPDSKLGEKAVLFLEGSYNQQKEEKLWKYLKNNLNKYEIPKKIAYLKEFYFTESGKLDKLKMTDEYLKN